MIVIALGANLPSNAGEPRKTLESALSALAKEGVAILRRSRWYVSPADPPSAQPDYVNGVAIVASERSPDALLDLLHAIEARYGRVRRTKNAARTLDLDLIDYGGLVQNGPPGPTLPHPRAHLRAFVLLPLSEIAPEWRHPVQRTTALELLRRLPSTRIEALAEPIELKR